MYYYHMTSLDNLRSISKQGLIPQSGVNSKLIGDEKIKVFFSEGFEGAIALFVDFQIVYDKDFDWAIAEATQKKKTDFSQVEFFSYDEGECVQCMHIGSYDDEPTTVGMMHDFAEKNGYEIDITESRYHHEIYLFDPRRCDVSKLKTVSDIRSKESKNNH